MTEILFIIFIIIWAVIIAYFQLKFWKDIAKSYDAYVEEQNIKTDN